MEKLINDVIKNIFKKSEEAENEKNSPEEKQTNHQQAKVQICPVCREDGIAADENGWCECSCGEYTKKGKL